MTSEADAAMVQDLPGALAILGVMLLCSVAAGLMIAFLQRRQSGIRAFWLFLAVGSVVATLQVFHQRYTGWVLGVGAVSLIGGYWVYARRKKRSPRTR